MDHYHVAWPLLMSVSNGWRRRDQLHPNNPEMGLWALTVFEDGWRLLDAMGTTWETLLRHLLSRWPPSMWLDDAVLLRRIPQELRVILHNEGLVFGPQASGLRGDNYPCASVTTTPGRLG